MVSSKSVSELSLVLLKLSGLDVSVWQVDALNILVQSCLQDSQTQGEDISLFQVRVVVAC